jgi:phosphatidylglycerol:prolipoprotein diacylglycerol transferase
VIQELFHIGSFSISPFGVILVAAFLAGYWQLKRGLATLEAGDEEDANAILFAAGVGGIAGAKIYYALLYRDWHLLLSRSGLVWYGGFALGTAAVAWTIARRRMPVWPTIDAATPALALGYGIGRVGCFLVGDDYGRPTDLPWGVAFPVGLPPTTAGYLRGEFHLAIPDAIPDAQLLRVHPTQIYETLIALAIWAVGLRLLARRPAAGGVALPVFALLAVERFAVEFLRAKDDRFLGPFTLAQAISVLVLGVLALLAWRRRQRALERAAPASAPATSAR